eukprot:TRINITY_DN1905_c0_g3_i1.p1 TRINITY_DN1905_c0_g3~~TRINITY_DN1905_c0_g3_i1.p1  ORF type:complete len:122 (-),score=25.82 TRINITY_DN1905_c0_g3_i1:39-404(-)
MCIRDRYMGSSGINAEYMGNYFLREGLMKVTSIVLLSLAITAISAQFIPYVRVVSPNSTATCPDGFQPASCACGYNCGSSYITLGSKNQCHCQCATNGWSAAHCMQLRTCLLYTSPSPRDS